MGMFGGSGVGSGDGRSGARAGVSERAASGTVSGTDYDVSDGFADFESEREPDTGTDHRANAKPRADNFAKPESIADSGADAGSISVAGTCSDAEPYAAADAKPCSDARADCDTPSFHGQHRRDASGEGTGHLQRLDDRGLFARRAQPREQPTAR